MKNKQPLLKTYIKIIDSSGIKEAKIIDVIKSNVIKIGAIVKVVVKKMQKNNNNYNIKKDLKFFALIVYSKRPFIKNNGITVKFNRTCGILLKDHKKVIPMFNNFKFDCLYELFERFPSLKENINKYI